MSDSVQRWDDRANESLARSRERRARVARRVRSRRLANLLALLVIAIGLGLWLMYAPGTLG